MSILAAKTNLEDAYEMEDEDDPTGKRRELIILSSIAESLLSIANHLNQPTLSRKTKND